ncbi:carbonic anhydrase [Paracoccaceae bacterium GXU_MW_L88]
MDKARPLPTYLRTRYAGWRAVQFAENKAWYARLADEGQRPRAMIISCCDSRVHVTGMFGADSGEFFIHRNIANMIPPYEPDDARHGTSAAIEYAVGSLKVSNLLVVGHSSCGGVAGCFDMCEGNAPQLTDSYSFVGKWMEILRPGYEKVKEMEGSREEKLTALEKEAVLVSLNNLMTFPFVESAVNDGTLSLHGLWNDIRNGTLEYYEPGTGFKPVP